MKIINTNDTILWLSSKGLMDSTEALSSAGFTKVMEAFIPADSGRKTALSKAIISLFELEDEGLLWINEFGMWPSSEDRHLFAGFRTFLGENSPLHEKPGHLFSREDLASTASLIAMSLYFVWGIFLYSSKQDFVIKTSHDEFITVYVKNTTMALNITQALKSVLE